MIRRLSSLMAIWRGDPPDGPYIARMKVLWRVPVDWRPPPTWRVLPKKAEKVREFPRRTAS